MLSLWSVPAVAGKISVAAAGDLQLGSATTPEVLEGVGALLVADVRFVNLEGPITLRGMESGLDGGQPRFAGPPAVAKGLQRRVDVVSLANNHAMDQGEAGLADTLRFLEPRGIAGATASAPAVITRHGIRVTLIARELEPRVAEQGLVEAVRAARASGPVLVSLHWGSPGSLLPTEAEKELAHRLIDAGASAVLGHGPHVPRGVELRGSGVIAYSLGNLAFSCPCTKDADAYVLRFELSAEGAVSQVEAIPIAAGLQAPPRRADPGLAELLVSLSKDLGSDARVVNGVVRVSAPVRPVKGP